MSTPILTTKLYIPTTRTRFVARPRLIEQLAAKREGKLTLISASAGFGKTTLVSEWIAVCQQPAAWYSLDDGDNDLTRFLTYLVAASRTVDPTIGADVLALLQSPQSSPIQTILTTYLNAITTLSNSLMLVLDDYHVIHADAIHQALAFLLDHLPPQMHIVITTREDPPLPLPRLRARGQLAELRAPDLCFTAHEATQFFSEVMGLALSTDQVIALSTHTEGWIAGLQLAAISIQGRTATASQTFIQTFTGSHQFIFDYLIEEVLQHQPDPIRDFLLQTSILDRLHGTLCDAVTGQDDGKSMLVHLERSNLFVVPLDDQRQWYRYHHLFADVLQTRLHEEQPAAVSRLHRSASNWYAQNDLPMDAVHHALATQDFAWASDLIELARPSIEKGYRDTIFRSWVEALPAELVYTRPVLNLGYVFALLEAGELAEVEARLQVIEGWLDAVQETHGMDWHKVRANPLHGMIVVDEAQFQALPASLSTARTYYTLAVGTLSDTVKYAQQALDHFPEGDYVRRGQVSGLLALAHWGHGNLNAALEAIAMAADYTEKAGSLLDIIGGAFVVADIHITLGQLNEAIRAYERAIQIVADHDEVIVLGIDNVYSGLSDLHREQGDFAAATEALAISKRLGEPRAERIWHYRWLIAQAKLQQSVGNLDESLDRFNQAERLYIRNPMPDVQPLAAMKTRIWLKQGKLADALNWAQERGLAVDSSLSYLQEYEHITLARVLLAQYQDDPTESLMQQIHHLLSRLLQAAEAGHRIGSVIEILILQALAHHAQDSLPAALAPLERALSLAEPEGYVRTFVDEGPPLSQLLQNLIARYFMPNYTNKLLAALETEKESTDTTPPISPSPHLPTSLSPLIEPLSQRELDVLRLFKTELSGPEIARELVIALSTVRTHTKRIYGKLSVNNRRAAVRRAEELGLI
ncbi:MAG: LuxR C-terminal-related transcriptional regulator [Chloroflexota bacterium]